MSTATTAIKERPILFSGAMVQAILEGRKLQTRRVVKNVEDAKRVFETSSILNGERKNTWAFEVPEAYRILECPHGQRGDRLWVRETFCVETDGENQWLEYRADNAKRHENIPLSHEEAVRYGDPVNGIHWRPSIHMPRWASRITLEIINVKVERLQDISEEDAIAEGLNDVPCIYRNDTPVGIVQDYDGISSFKTLWNSINRDRGYGWDSNPWVWAIEFKRVE